MPILETEAKSLLRKAKYVDSWFISAYGMNLFRGCSHNCSYCDGRSEKYRVDGDFAKDILVKTNAAELLDRELNPARKRKPMKKAYIFMGGGVTDMYQHAAEQKYGLARNVLEVIHKYRFPVHVLTKSDLVLRDLPLLREMNRNTGVMVSMSFSGVDETVSRHFEPGVPSPKRRLDALREIREAGIPAGMYLMPVLPHISDTETQLEASIQAAQAHDLSFIVFGGLTLKKGRQKSHFLDKLRQFDDSLVSEYRKIYRDKPYGEPDWRYARKIDRRFHRLVRHYKIPTRIPPQYFRNQLNENDFAAVILEHIDYYLKRRGIESPLIKAAYALRKAETTISDMPDLQVLNGVNQKTAALIRELSETGRSAFYERIRGW